MENNIHGFHIVGNTLCVLTWFHSRELFSACVPLQSAEQARLKSLASAGSVKLRYLSFIHHRGKLPRTKGAAQCCYCTTQGVRDVQHERTALQSSSCLLQESTGSRRLSRAEQTWSSSPSYSFSFWTLWYCRLVLQHKKKSHSETPVWLWSGSVWKYKKRGVCLCCSAVALSEIKKKKSQETSSPLKKLNLEQLLLSIVKI